ncbi:MAG: hypothetical protein ACKOJF_33925, partial [Planctomycetaceae bacterium]
MRRTALWLLPVLIPLVLGLVAWTVVGRVSRSRPATTADALPSQGSASLVASPELLEDPMGENGEVQPDEFDPEFDKTATFSIVAVDPETGVVGAAV